MSLNIVLGYYATCITMDGTPPCPEGHLKEEEMDYNHFYVVHSFIILYQYR